MTELREYDVSAPTQGGIKSYRVMAPNEDAAVFKVVTLHNVLNWPLRGQVKALTNDQ